MKAISRINKKIRCLLYGHSWRVVGTIDRKCNVCGKCGRMSSNKIAEKRGIGVENA